MLSESATEPVSEGLGSKWQWYAFGLAAVTVGAALRFVWGGDIEYKFDESYMFQRAVSAGISEPFPWVGMPSGAGVANPAASVWIFIAMARLFGTGTPPELARVVQLLNVVALASTMIFGFVMVGCQEWRTWTWGVALACVNPFAVLFGRKIWAQSVLPLFCLPVIVGWWKRDTRWGAFTWGLAGAWLGQIHLSGFFFAGSLLVWTVFGDRSETTKRARRPVPWLWWVTGSVLGAVTLVPWVVHLARHGVSAHHNDYFAVLFLHNIFGLWYWVLWITGAFGLGMSYSLGLPEFFAFLKYPLVDGTPTYLMAAAHAILFAMGCWLLLRRAWPSADPRFVRQGVRWGGDESAERLVVAGLFGCGLLLLAAGFPIHRHYLVVTFPLQWFWLSRQMRSAARHWNRLLALIWMCELVISAGFLFYIHTNGGALTGDYGTAYIRQR